MERLEHEEGTTMKHYLKMSFWVILLTGMLLVMSNPTYAADKESWSYAFTDKYGFEYFWDRNSIRRTNARSVPAAGGFIYETWVTVEVDDTNGKLTKKKFRYRFEYYLDAYTGIIMGVKRKIEWSYYFDEKESKWVKMKKDKNWVWVKDGSTERRLADLVAM